MDEATERVSRLQRRAADLGVCVEALPSAGRLLGRRRGRAASATGAGVLCVSVTLLLALGLHTHHGFARFWLTWQRLDVYDTVCAIQVPDVFPRVFRPPEDCSMCEGISQVEKVSNISPEDFEEKYAYSGRPVVVTDAMLNWTAPQVFSMQFFKSIYNHSSQLNCQFFPYETEFLHLQEAFDMSSERALRSWYIGWSNCDEKVSRILREHYSRPYFLPVTAENKKIDWIFMGSSGYGAHLHVDNVGHSSWQAQLRGRKLWTLEPPPECYYVCRRVHVEVEPGQIIVIDTNRWYHKTLIVSEDMSLTIGAEYD